MKLHEYQSKEIFRQYGIPTPSGMMCNTVDDAVSAVHQMGKAIIKAQVLVGGRGKAGGVKPAGPENAWEIAQFVLGLTIKGLPVKKVLVEEIADISQEFYISLTLDRTSRQLIFIASASGGMDIEEVARLSPHLIFKEYIDSYLGPSSPQLTSLSGQLGIKDAAAFSSICRNIFEIYDRLDCTLVEINPLILDGEGRLLALDAKMNIDDNALFRQPEMQELQNRNVMDLDPLEVQAMELGMSYVSMDGNIGCIVNGAGLALATLDMISIFGGTPANFMDVRGGADAFHVGRAVEITSSNPETEVMLINMFGGLTRCDQIAEGIKDNLQKLKIPVVIRLTGTNQEEGWEILKGAHLTVSKSTEEAARIAVEMVK